jgi:shikimate dehydrogenase
MLGKELIMINGKTKLLGVLGWPVEHSFSPLMHNAALAKAGINGAYLPIPVAPAHLNQVVKSLVNMGFIGVNVTIPHKEAVSDLCDFLSPLAAITRSVNTLHFKDQKIYGSSTDAYGAIENLKSHGHSLKNKRIALIGNGGAARALAWAFCLNDPSVDYNIKSLTIVGRNLQKVQNLCLEIGQGHSRLKPGYLAIKDLPSILADTDLVINATSVGMSPNSEDSPFDTSVLESHNIVYDIVYNPIKTKLLCEAELLGCPIVTGLGMLVYQGALSFETWFEQKPDIEIMKKALQI